MPAEWPAPPAVRPRLQKITEAFAGHSGWNLKFRHAGILHEEGGLEFGVCGLSLRYRLLLFWAVSGDRLGFSFPQVTRVQVQESRSGPTAFRFLCDYELELWEPFPQEFRDEGRQHSLVDLSGLVAEAANQCGLYSSHDGRSWWEQVRALDEAGRTGVDATNSCPRCRGPLTHPVRGAAICPACRLAFCDPEVSPVFGRNLTHDVRTEPWRPAMLSDAELQGVPHVWALPRDGGLMGPVEATAYDRAVVDLRASQ